MKVSEALDELIKSKYRSKKKGRNGKWVYSYKDIGNGYKIEKNEEASKNGTDIFKLTKDGVHAGGIQVADKGTHGEVKFSAIDEEHRGHGIGKEMYEFIATHYNELHSDTALSDQAKRLWKKISSGKIKDDIFERYIIGESNE